MGWLGTGGSLQVRAKAHRSGLQLAALPVCLPTGTPAACALGRRAWSARCAPSRTGPAAWRQRPSAASRRWAPPRRSATPSQVLVNLALTAAGHSCWGCKIAERYRAATALLPRQEAREFTGRHDMPVTPAGRQCMASSLMLQGRHAEALPYLDSIGEYCSGDDAYHWNLGMARAAAGARGAGGGAGVGGLAQAESRGTKGAPQLRARVVLGGLQLLVPMLPAAGGACTAESVLLALLAPQATTPGHWRLWARCSARTGCRTRASWPGWRGATSPPVGGGGKGAALAQTAHVPNMLSCRCCCAQPANVQCLPLWQPKRILPKAQTPVPGCLRLTPPRVRRRTRAGMAAVHAAAGGGGGSGAGGWWRGRAPAAHCQRLLPCRGLPLGSTGL